MATSYWLLFEAGKASNIKVLPAIETFFPIPRCPNSTSVVCHGPQAVLRLQARANPIESCVTVRDDMSTYLD